MVISDLPEYLPLLEKNIALNKDAFKDDNVVQAKKIVWGDKDDYNALKDSLGSRIDLVLVSDCVYYEASLKPLVSTLLDLTEASGNAEILISFEERESAQKQAVQEGFFALVREHFVVQEVSASECHPQYSCPEIRVLRLRRKRE